MKKKGEKLGMSAGKPCSSAPLPPNEAAGCCMEHFLSTSLSFSWGRGRVKQFSVARDVIIPQKQGSFSGPGDDVVSQRGACERGHVVNVMGAAGLLGGGCKKQE